LACHVRRTVIKKRDVGRSKSVSENTGSNKRKTNPKTQAGGTRGMIIQDIGAKLMGDVVQRRLDMGAETTIKTLHGRRVYITKTGGRRGRRSRRRSKKRKRERKQRLEARRRD